MKLFLLSLISCPLIAASITVLNDSSYFLSATIYSGTKKELTTLEIPTGHSVQWADGPYNSRNYSKGPYTIVFTCPNGDEFGTVSKVPENSTVYAKRATGRRKCKEEGQPTPHRDFHENQPHWKY